MGTSLALLVIGILGVGGQALGQWTYVEEATLIPAGTTYRDFAGASVTLDGDTAVLGAPYRYDNNWVFGSVKGLSFRYWPSGLGATLFGVDAFTEQMLSLPISQSAAQAYRWTKPSPAGMTFDASKQFLYIAHETGLLLRFDVYHQPSGSWATGLPLQALAFDPLTGTLYGSTSDQLVVLVPGANATITTSVVGSFGFADVRGLTFDSLTGTLFGSEGTTDQLLTIDTTTGVATAVGSLGFGDVEGLAYDDFSTELYGSDTATASLIKIDAATGLAQAVMQITGPIADSGAAYVFERTGTSWKEQAKLTPSTPQLLDSFGIATSVSGETVVVGAPGPVGSNIPGSAFVFLRSGTQWVQQAVLQASDNAPGDQFGHAVVIENDTILVGAPYDDHAAGVDSGSVYVFERQGTSWSESAKLIATSAAAGDAFGLAIDLSGSRALIGAPYTSIGVWQYVGVGYTFVRNGLSWKQEARLSRDPFLWSYNMDIFGKSVALSGDTAMLGAPYYYPGWTSYGAAWVYQRTASGWSKPDIVLPPKTAAGEDAFAWSVAADGHRLLSGTLSNIGWGGGNVHLITPNTPKPKPWKKSLTMTSMIGVPSDLPGWSVALSGDTVLAGAPNANNAGGVSAGSATVYRLVPPPPTSFCPAGTSASGCTVAISAAGISSASASTGMVLTASGVEGLRPGLFLYGTGTQQTNPWGNGTSLQCVTPPLSTGGVMLGSGTLGACNGTFTQDLNALWCPTCPKPAMNPGEGSVVQAQLWYRDPMNTSNQTTSFSNAIEFWVGP